MGDGVQASKDSEEEESGVGITAVPSARTLRINFILRTRRDISQYRPLIFC